MSYALDDPRVLSLAPIIRASYCLQRRLWAYRREGTISTYGDTYMPGHDGGTDSMGRTTRAIWPKLAACFLERNIDVDDYLRYRFDDRITSPPKPQQLASPDALDAYQRSGRRDLAIAGVRDALQAQMHTADTYVRLRNAGRPADWTDTDVVISVLTDLTLSLSYLFRYAAGSQGGYHAVVRAYFEDARAQYQLEAPAYDAAWGELLPEEIRTGILPLEPARRSATPSQGRPLRNLTPTTRS